MKKVDKIAIKCDSCGANLLVYPCLMKRSKKHFCNVDCKNNWFRENAKGKEAPHWKGGDVKTKCAECGKIIFRRKAKIKRNKNNFCSKDCEGRWKSINCRGIKIYNFKGGIKAARERRKSNIKDRLNARIRTMVRYSLNGNKNGYSWEGLVGYSSDDLRSHLDKTMPTGRTWNDFMEGELEIDHIIPICRFNFSKADHIDFKKCWGIKNLRLLDKNENRRKHAKLSKPFQPSLALGVRA